VSQQTESGMHFDFASWPILTITQVGACSDERVDAYLVEMKKLYDRNARHAIVLDLRAGVPFNSKQRKRQSDWLSISRDRVHNVAGIAFVEDSLLMRGAMQAGFWLNPPEYPYLLTKHLAEGHHWARERYQLGTSRVA